MKTITYPIASNQAAFDHVWHHFVVEKNPPGRNELGCLYDTPSGGCAIGCLLPKEVRAKLPSCSVRTAGARGWIAAYFDPVDLDFLEVLQKTHDNWALDGPSTPENIAELLTALATEFNLTVPV